MGATLGTGPCRARAGRRRKGRLDEVFVLRPGYAQSPCMRRCYASTVWCMDILSMDARPQSARALKNGDISGAWSLMDGHHGPQNRRCKFRRQRHCPVCATGTVCAMRRRAADNAPRSGWPACNADCHQGSGQCSGLAHFHGLRCLRSKWPRRMIPWFAPCARQGQLSSGKTNTPEIGLGSHTFKSGAWCHDGKSYDPDKNLWRHFGGAAVAVGHWHAWPWPMAPT